MKGKSLFTSWLRSERVYQIFLPERASNTSQGRIVRHTWPEGRPRTLRCHHQSLLPWRWRAREGPSGIWLPTNDASRTQQKVCALSFKFKTSSRKLLRKIPFVITLFNKPSFCVQISSRVTLCFIQNVRRSTTTFTCPTLFRMWPSLYWSPSPLCLTLLYHLWLIRYKKSLEGQRWPL